MVLGYTRVVDCLVGIASSWNAVASLVLLPSAAERLPFPFRALAQTPQLTLVLGGGGYLGFLVLFLPLYAVSFIVTATGAWFVLLGAVYMAGRGLTRTISYPGASKQIQRDIELEYTKSVSGRLVSFANGLRLWLQLVRDVTVVPSAMGHFRALHEELRDRVQRGDMWVLTRALEELTENASRPIENGNTAAGAAAAAAGANSLAPSAAMEAESLLKCLSELLPMLEKALSITDKLSECSSTHEFDRKRQALLLPGAGNNDRLETLATRVMKLSRQLRSRKKKKPAAASTSSSSSSSSSSSRARTTSGSPTPAVPSPVADEEAAVGLGGGADDDDDEDDDDDDDDDIGVEGAGGVPTEESPSGGASGDSGFPGAIVKSWWRSRYPYEGAAGFGLMREEMLIKSNAQQIWLAMSDGTLLDCCYCKAYGGRNGGARGGGGGGGDRSGSVSGGLADERSSTGCVLFCNPNAGYYESMVLAGEGNRNWVSFYTSVGCDVFLFNYRGYGRSGGSASPGNINKDVREVVDYLREQVGVTRLAVHGESIGGVAAASVARHSQVDLLVLDRSFSSLSAVAQRLMGGWTKWAIWGFTGWDAHVAADYLGCRCYKVLACDPEDMMISEGSSTKAGVSVMVELGTHPSSLDVYEPPKAYKVADYLRTCPPVERVSLPLCPQERLTSLQIAHFAACLRYIARKAPRMGAAESRGSPAGAANRRRRQRHRRGELPTDMDTVGSQEVEMEMVSIGKEGGKRDRDCGSGGGSGDATGDAGGRQEGEAPSGPDPLAEGSSPSAIDMSRPLGEIWVLLARVDGLCGRMLGRAVAKGFDDVRAWVCCLVVLGPVVRADTTGRREELTGSLPVESASHRMQTLLEQHPDELGSDPFVTFVSNMLRYLAQRVALGGVPPPPLATAATTSMLSSPASCRRVLGLVRRGGPGVASDGTGGGGGGGRRFDGRRGGGGAVVSEGGSGEPGLAGLESGVGVEDGDRGFGMELVEGHGQELLGGGEGGVSASSRSSPTAAVGDGGSGSIVGAGPSLGKLLPLHCGHNNAYGDAERRMLLEHLALQGWVAPDRRPLDAMSTQQQ
eukprot:g7416.t2